MESGGEKRNARDTLHPPRTFPTSIRGSATLRPRLAGGGEAGLHSPVRVPGKKPAQLAAEAGDVKTNEDLC